MSETRRARAVGFNHVALEVGDIEEALSFYERILEFKLRGKSKDMAFIDLGDQFLALQKGRSQPSDGGRHFGLVVDDKNAARRALAEAGVEVLPGPFLEPKGPHRRAIKNRPRPYQCERIKNAVNCAFLALAVDIDVTT